MSNKIGRPRSTISSKLRPWFWYCVIKEMTGLKDAWLDIKFCRETGSPPATRDDYLERVKAFESIRLNGGQISRGLHPKRGFDLLKNISEYPELKGTVALYDHVFWEYLADTRMGIDRCVEVIFECSEQLKLTEVAWPSLQESAELTEILYAFDDWKDFTDVPESAHSYSENLLVFDLLDNEFELTEIDLDDLTAYLYVMTLLGVLFRYCYLRGRLHAALAVEEYLVEFILPLRNIPWLQREFIIPGNSEKKTFVYGDLLFDFIYNKIKSPEGLLTESSLTTIQVKFDGGLNSLNCDSPFRRFLTQFQ